MKKWILAAVLIGISLIGKIVTGYITYGGTDTVESFLTEVGPEAELVEVFWYQNAMEYGSCFWFRIYTTGQDDSVPLLYCSYTDRDTLERVEVGDEWGSEACPSVPIKCWKELSDFLREAELPAYQEPDPDLLDATVSQIQVTWRDGEEQFTNSYEGISANDLLELLQDIVEEAVPR